MEVKHEGRELKSHEVPRERLEIWERSNVSEGFVSRVARIAGWKTLELSESERGILGNSLHVQKKYTKHGLVPIVFIGVIVVPVFFSGLYSIIDRDIVPAVICTVLSTALGAGGFIMFSERQRLAKKQLAAFENGRYTVYELDVLEKMWYRYYQSSSREYGGSTVTAVTEFYIDCGDITLESTQSEYEAITDKVAVVFFFIDNKTSLGCFAAL